MGILSWLSNNLLKARWKIGPNFTVTKTISQRLCPKCHNILDDNLLRPDLKSMQEGGSVEIKCPKCGFKLGTATLMKREKPFQ